jgi:kynurenine formamidase
MQAFARFCLAAAWALPLAAQPPQLSQQDVERLMTELSNWGRWGRQDQMGALNLITPDKRKSALKLVREGVSVSLAREVEKSKAPDVDQPFAHRMNITSAEWSGDEYSVFYHGYAHTHMDAPCHMAIGGRMYNGFSRDEVKQTGCEKLAVSNFKNGILTRGVLIDIPWLKGRPFLEPGEAVTLADLEEWEKRSRVKIQPGDVIFLYTGRWKRRAEKGPWPVSQQAAGVHALTAKWIKAKNVAMVGSDASFDVLPSQVPGFTHPMHALLLVAMGVPIFDNCDLEALSAEARKRSRWDFLLTAAPLAVPGGTGSPLNPIATF